jgi:hypothetical protein
MDVASDVDRRTKSCIGKISKIRSNTALRISKAIENEFIDPRTANIANKKMEKSFIKFETDAIKVGMLKKIDILGKWFSPENEREKNLMAQIKKKTKQ